MHPLDSVRHKIHHAEAHLRELDELCKSLVAAEPCALALTGDTDSADSRRTRTVSVFVEEVKDIPAEVKLVDR